MTEYQVLAKAQDDKGWEVVGEPVEASSPRAAVRAVIEDEGIEDPVPFWRAIPTRSWTREPIQPEVEIERKVTFK
jgi:hypothetical protein